MYSTCIHCQQALGTNLVLEHLPIGRRIAFDAAAGRVWVICGGCGRWNLVPFESRWEALDEAERGYRTAELRATTDQVGLARTREGTELIRIGAPPVQEFASWRYGRFFGKRRWNYFASTVPMMVLGGLATQPNLLMDIARIHIDAWMRLGLMVGTYIVGGELQARLVTYRTLATLLLRDAEVPVSRMIAGNVRAAHASDGAVSIWVPVIREPIEAQRWFPAPMSAAGLWWDLLRHGDLTFRTGRLMPTHFTRTSGDEAQAVLRTILPVLNEAGGTRGRVASALELLRDHGSDPSQVVTAGVRRGQAAEGVLLREYRPERRLALEMAVHTDSERRWLEGEMTSLLEEWKRASEIATIADGLLTDPAVEQRLAELRSGATAPE